MERVRRIAIADSSPAFRSAAANFVQDLPGYTLAGATDTAPQALSLIDSADVLLPDLGMPPVQVYEVASFYTMYNLKPTGRHKLTICTCLPCGLQGSLAAADHLREKLGIDFNETTPDGRFTLKEGECMGACAMAPVLLVNNKKMHDYMSREKLDQLLQELK